MKKLSSIIDNSLYGIELDKELYEHTLMTLKEESQRKFNLFLTLPNLVQGDALDYNLKTDFDYIIGNPPYVRIHNIEPAYRDKLKQHFIYTLGTSDLYVIFFEKSLQLLNPQGELIFITPNSWIKNVSQSSLREQLITEKR